MRRIVFFCGLLIALLHGFSTKASHIIGGEIQYECLGNDNYLITIKVYRDCFTGIPPFDNPLYLAVYNSTGTLVSSHSLNNPVITLIPPYINNPCLEGAANLCVEEGIYTTTLNLPSIPGGYTLVHQRCCRNPTILNILTPDAVGFSLTTHISTDNNMCNNSAEFQNYPPIALCVSDAFSFDHSAVDADGDSLYYAFTNPFVGATTGNPQPITPSAPPFSPVLWSAGYSTTNPIFSNPAFSIDPNSGLITGTPTQIGQYVLCVSAFEYRNGVLLTENRREFQFNVVQCVGGTVASLTYDNDLCESLEVSFQNMSVVSSYFLWDFGVDGIVTDTSSLENPTYTYPDTVTYTVMLIANPGYICADTTYMTIQLFLNPEPFFEAEDVELCERKVDVPFQLLSYYDSESLIQWNFGNGQTANIPNPTTQYNQTGSYWVEVTVQQGPCMGTFGDSLKVDFIPCGEMTIPNVFTPNQDGLNDTWQPIEVSILEYDIYIYNRWGRLVHEYSGTVGSYLGWDGTTMGGGEAPEGTYYVIAKGLALSGETIEDQGFITLIR